MLSIKHLNEPSLQFGGDLQQSDWTFAANMKWKEYIESITRPAARNSGLLSCARRFICPESITFRILLLYMVRYSCYLSRDTLT